MSKYIWTVAVRQGMRDENAFPYRETFVGLENLWIPSAYGGSLSNLNPGHPVSHPAECDRVSGGVWLESRRGFVTR